MKIGVTGRRLVLVVFLLVILPTCAHAQLVITEIMYNLQSGSDSGREWIEVYNKGTSPVPLTEWKLYENGANHKIIAAGDVNTLAPASYAVIADNAADFKNDWPEFSGQLFDSAFSLSNTGETLTMRNASSSDVDALSYQSSWGAAGDGNSLDRAPGETGTFVARRPSPGAAMSSDVIPTPVAKLSSASKTKTTSVKNTAPRSVSIDPTNTSDSAGDIPDAKTFDTQTTPTEVAAGAASGSSLAWWIAAGALALAAAGALIAARRVGKREWDITEEK